jgi:hypothetical protein
MLEPSCHIDILYVRIFIPQAQSLKKTVSPFSAGTSFFETDLPVEIAEHEINFI